MLGCTLSFIALCGRALWERAHPLREMSFCRGEAPAKTFWGGAPVWLPGLAVPAGFGYNGRMKRKTLRNDLLLIAALLLAALGLWALLRLTKPAGAEAVVTVDGETVAVLPLDGDTVLNVGADRGFSNTVEVSDGRVRVRDADCPDRLCVRQGWLSRDGESAVCLPHKLTVTVRGGETPGVDAVAR